ncbi:MAG: peroxidase-related enzyme [Candidatus Bipolaricaulia bacterium]
MAWIRVIDEAEAQGRLKECYEEIKKARGKVANIMRVHSLQPDAMMAHLNFYKTIMFGPSGLSRRQRELLATVVSALNGCAYCVRHHAEALRAYVKDEALIGQVQRDYTTVPLDSKSRAMLDYAHKLTRSPTRVTQQDIEQLRYAGFSDAEILSVNLIVSYFNFVNRVALGLGVEFTEDEAQGYRY